MKVLVTVAKARDAGLVHVPVRLFSSGPGHRLAGGVGRSVS
ncbi:hypothetical protein AB0J55_02280 [Amycolatopsis sp. NPDC049688]